MDARGHREVCANDSERSASHPRRADARRRHRDPRACSRGILQRMRHAPSQDAGSVSSILRHLELLRGEVTDWSAYPFDIPAVAGLHKLELDCPVVFLVGENGSGKSTLIEAIAIKAGFNPEGGSKNFTSKHRPSESPL